MEQELKCYLSSVNIPFKDNTDSYKQLDFTFELSKRKFNLNVKEKKTTVPNEELAIR